MGANKPKTTVAITASVLQWEKECSNKQNDLCSNLSAESHEWKMEYLFGFIPHHYLTWILPLFSVRAGLVSVNAHSLRTETCEMLRMIHSHRIQPEMETVSNLMTSQGEIRIKHLKQVLQERQITAYS